MLTAATAPSTHALVAWWWSGPPRPGSGAPLSRAPAGRGPAAARGFRSSRRAPSAGTASSAPARRAPRTGDRRSDCAAASRALVTSPAGASVSPALTTGWPPMSLGALTTWLLRMAASTKARLAAVVGALRDAAEPGRGALLVRARGHPRAPEDSSRRGHPPAACGDRRGGGPARRGPARTSARPRASDASSLLAMPRMWWPAMSRSAAGCLRSATETLVPTTSRTAPARCTGRGRSGDRPRWRSPRPRRTGLCCGPARG